VIPFPYQTAGAGLVGQAGGGEAPVVDPKFASVGYLLLGDGANGGTVFTDSGPNAFTVTRNGTTGGGITTSTADYLFAPSSIRGPWSSGNRLRMPNNALCRGAGGAWVWEAALKRDPAAAGASQVLMDGNNGSSNTTGPAIYIGTDNKLWLYDGSVSANRGGAITVPTDVWLWLAVQWDPEAGEGGELQFYLQGDLDQVVTSFTNTWGNVSPVALLGDQFGGQSFQGHIEQIRFTREARYSGGSYAVPAAPFPTA
jgi:hypothetical protein